MFCVRVCVFYAAYDARFRTVFLSAGCERPRAFEETKKAAAVLKDVLRRVVVAEASEIKRVVRHRTRAARPG